VASSTVLISVASSTTAAAAETSLVVKVDPPSPDPQGAIDAATLGSGYDAVTALGACCLDSVAPLIVDLPLRNCLILL
jgi:hypothetical protein